MKKYLLIAAGLATLTAATLVPSQSAQASWAESAQGNPVYTGTNRSLWRSERAQRRFSHRPYGWDSGYSAYGYAPGYSGYGYGYRGDYYR